MKNGCKCVLLLYVGPSEDPLRSIPWLSSLPSNLFQSMHLMKGELSIILRSIEVTHFTKQMNKVINLLKLHCLMYPTMPGIFPSIFPGMYLTKGPILPNLPVLGRPCQRGVCCNLRWGRSYRWLLKIWKHSLPQGCIVVAPLLKNWRDPKSWHTWHSLDNGSGHCPLHILADSAMPTSFDFVVLLT